MSQTATGYARGTILGRILRPSGPFSAQPTEHPEGIFITGTDDSDAGSNLDVDADADADMGTGGIAVGGGLLAGLFPLFSFVRKLLMGA